MVHAEVCNRTAGTGNSVTNDDGVKDTLINVSNTVSGVNTKASGS